ncbi:hypothetical protein E4U37_005333 [Claviceps purpurea]|nr:hypothetical protein E4U37_005333 [Claviceps purpurea]
MDMAHGWDGYLKVKSPSLHDTASEYHKYLGCLRYPMLPPHISFHDLSDGLMHMHYRTGQRRMNQDQDEDPDVKGRQYLRNQLGRGQ